MKRIITITRTVQHFVDILTDCDTEAEARTKALADAGTDHRYWDVEQGETPWVLAVRDGEADELVPVAFSVYIAALDSEECFFPAQHIAQIPSNIANEYTSKHGGVDVTVERVKQPEVFGEYQVSGLFPRAFAEARSYPT